MQRIHIAAIGITLAISSGATWAAPGDASHGTFRDEDKQQRSLLEPTPTPPESATTYNEPLAVPPVREGMAPVPEASERRDYWVEAPAPRTAPHYDPRHPQTGQLIERGLFNRTGPNDFGA